MDNLLDFLFDEELNELATPILLVDNVMDLDELEELYDN
jgi:hypothetical protein